MKKTLLFMMALTLLISYEGFSQKQRSFASYYDLRDFQQASPNAYKFGLYGFDNPAVLSYLVSPFDLQLMASDKRGNLNNFNNWGIFWGSNNSGFGALITKDKNHAITDYRYSLSLFGDRIFSVGLNYGFVGGDKSFFKRSNTMGWGALYRPLQQLSLSVQQTYALSDHDAESVVEAAIRPFGNAYPIALFGDFAMFHDQKIKEGKWSAGISWEVIDGLRINSRYFDDKSIRLGFELSMGSNGYGAILNTDDKQKISHSTYSIRLGGPDRTFYDKIKADKDFIKLELNGKVGYQKSIFFNRITPLTSIFEQIDIAKKDKNVVGLAINITNLQASLENLWEIREKLKEFKATGKLVYIFVENMSFRTYELASVADKIFIDPLGSTSLEGFALGSSYYKRMLDKIGIGFDELRYFKYKSAAESLSRDSMSDADREQKQRLIDNFYDEVKSDVCKSRNFTPEQFDKFVNDQIMYNAKQAKELKLVDELGRWHNADELIKRAAPYVDNIKTEDFLDRTLDPIDNKWSEPEDIISIINIVGDCSMDNGIKARTLVNDVKAACNNSKVKAIILRVDSPGGDAMASDYIAEVVRENKYRKPIIISQGSLAASGGYWLSMDGTKIVSSPLTITGSIGVIAGFAYDKGLKDTLGISTSLVKRGKYSDFGFSYQLPVIPIAFPVRDLTKDEKDQFEKDIKAMYSDFVNKVAQGRNISYAKVDSIAQGRVWTGRDAKNNGLVDEIGGLSKAIEVAKQQAGIPLDKEIKFTYYPKPALFDFNDFMSALFGVKLNIVDPKMQILLDRLQLNGVPAAYMPLEYYDFAQ